MLVGILGWILIYVSNRDDDASNLQTFSVLKSFRLCWWGSWAGSLYVSNRDDDASNLQTLSVLKSFRLCWWGSWAGSLYTSAIGTMTQVT